MDRTTKLAAAITDSNARMVTVSVCAFVIAACFKFTAVGMLLRFGVQSRYLRLQDAAMTGLLAALLVFCTLAAMAARRRYVRQQIQVVSNLNHELRNALEVILGSQYLPKSNQAEAILDSVNRIQRSLTELLGRSSQ